ncbi:hypothetical protein MED222_05310 [Vibrio sp. MED222]|nr:hypothetical protein MED222_05310 [Vibrio sp. MED222]
MHFICIDRLSSRSVRGQSTK